MTPIAGNMSARQLDAQIRINPVNFMRLKPSLGILGWNEDVNRRELIRFCTSKSTVNNGETRTKGPFLFAGRFS